MSLQHFDMTHPGTSVMPPPGVEEYWLLRKDMPALPLFVHRGKGIMQALNKRIASRNNLIAEHARESGTGAGMNGDRLLYYSSMLAGEGEAVCIHTEAALDIWLLVTEQVKAYMTHKAKDEHFVDSEFVPETLSALPKEELFPLLRKQLVTFKSRP